MKQAISTSDVWCMTGDAKQPTRLLIRISGDCDDIECEFDSGSKAVYAGFEFRFIENKSSALLYSLF